MTEPPAAVLRLVDITKTFPGVVAADAVSFELKSGEVHAIVGENGAGKSTLINMISGVLRPDAGRILLDGSAVRLTDPVAARNRGIVTVHQEAELFPTLSIAENMSLGIGLPTGRLGLVDWAAVRRSSQAAVDQIGEPIDVHAPADRLGVARRHMIQVAAAATQEARIVILDEPTSSLSTAESEWLFAQMERLKSAGAGIIYISHRQDEIFRLADRITVLRDGQAVWTGPRSEIDRQRLIELMVGRDQSPPPHAEATTTPERPVADAASASPRLRIVDVSDDDGRVGQVSLTVSAGESLGVYGLVGAGRTELAHCLFGLRPIATGYVEIDGQRQRIRSPTDAVRAGLAYLPEDRLQQGLCRGLSVRANCVLASLSKWTCGLLAVAGPERAATNDIVHRLDVRLHSIEQPVIGLSGGNQQKVVLGRWLLNAPKVLILDEPTRGVDIGSKAEIHRILRRLADDGCAVLMISSELPEIMHNSDRIAVFCAGSLTGEYDPQQVSPADVASAALPAFPETQRKVESVASTAASAGGPDEKTVLSRTVSRLSRSGSEVGLAMVTLVLWLCLAAGSRGSADLMSGLTNLATYAPLWTLLGLSAACVIIAGGIDISIGSLVALSAVCCGIVLQLDVPDVIRIPAAVAVGVAVGTAGGLINAAFSLIGRVHPIVVTLGTMTVYRGLVIVILGGQSLTGLPGNFTRLAVDPQTGFRGILAISAFVVCLSAVWLGYTRSGRHLFAYGSSPAASRLAGISQTRVWLTSFGVGGALAGLAGVLELSLNTQMQARLGAGWELQAIAIAVIGGVAITGGRGTVVGVVLAAVLLRLVNSALVRWGVSGPKVDLVVGTLLLAAVLLDLLWRRRRP